MTRIRIHFAVLAGVLAVGSLGLAVSAAGRRAVDPLRAFAKLIAAVDLSAEQRAEIKAILVAERPEISALADRELEARTALLDAVQRPTTDEAAVRAASAGVSAVDVDAALERADVYARIAAVLTDEQRAAAASFVSEIRPAVTREIDRSVGPKAGIDGLDLTDEQRAEIEAILASHEAAFEALGERERAAREALVAAIRQPSPNEAAVREASAAVAAVDADLAVERAHASSEVSAVLTTEQQARLAEARDRLASAVFERAAAIYDLGTRLL